MRNDNCRVTIIHRNGMPMARGFIADRRHILTCLHNIELCLGRSPAIGDSVEIETNFNQRLWMRVVKLGDTGHDVCALERTDSNRFALTDCALWRRGAEGTPYYGLGMTQNFANTALSGRLMAMQPGGKLQLIQASGSDNRVEPGCSGAALFEERDGPLLGMVTTYQQSAAGCIYTAAALAEFWPTLAPFDAAPTEAFPSLLPARSQTLPVSLFIREVDRMAQKTKLGLAIENGGLLTRNGFVIAGFVALGEDLPEASVDGLFHWTIAPIIRKLAPDSTKVTEPRRLALRDVIGDGTQVRETLLFNLKDCLDAPTSNIEDVRAALRATLTPLTLSLNAVERDLDLLTPAVVRECGAVMRELAIPEDDQPVAVLIYVLAQNEAALPDIRSRLADIDVWCVPLQPLEPIRLTDIGNWTAKHYRDLAERDHASDKINAIIQNAAGGRQEFRLKELKIWLNTGT